MSGPTVKAVGTVVTIPPLPAPVMVIEGLYPCRFCGSTGQCEHLVDVIWLEDGAAVKRPVGVRAEMGVEWGRRRLEGLRAALICLADGGTDG